jgi:hypothetical protein
LRGLRTFTSNPRSENGQEKELRETVLLKITAAFTHYRPTIVEEDLT